MQTASRARRNWSRKLGARWQCGAWAWRNAKASSSARPCPRRGRGRARGESDIDHGGGAEAERARGPPPPPPRTDCRGGGPPRRGRERCDAAKGPASQKREDGRRPPPPRRRPPGRPPAGAAAENKGPALAGDRPNRGDFGPVHRLHRRRRDGARLGSLGLRDRRRRLVSISTARLRGRALAGATGNAKRADLLPQARGRPSSWRSKRPLQDGRGHAGASCAASRHRSGSRATP